MENFKLIQEESFESISKYLNLIYKLTELEEPLAFVDVDGKRCMITKIVNYDIPVNTGYVVVYEEDGELKPAAYFYDIKDDTTAIWMDGYGYRFDEDLVVRENMNNLFKEQLSLSELIEEDARKCFVFSQVDPLNKKEVEMQFLLGHRKDTNQVLPYLKHKNPNVIMLSNHGIILPHERSYYFENDIYHRFIRVSDEGIRFLPFTKKYNPNDMCDEIEQMGCQSQIPNDLVDLYLNQNQKVKCLRRVVDTYKKNTKL